MKKTFIIASLLGLSLFTLAQPLPKRLYTSYRVNEAPIINGNLDDAAWVDAYRFMALGMTDDARAKHDVWRNKSWFSKTTAI